jgi:2-polyprenyl-6-hydroxyphenyl methylase/3-demethylubiquinone-9 3-methyltransferase
LVQRYATGGIKKRLWDHEFASGRWECLDNMAGDCLYSHVERFANRGSILDLGCGPGATGSELAFESYSSYVGVDISTVAIEKAKDRASQIGRASKNTYFCGDIFTYVPTGLYDVLVFGDSMYYVPWPQILGMLRRYSSYLTQNGVFVARLYGRRFQPIINTITEHFEVIEAQTYPLDSDEIYVLAFRPRRSRHEAA